MKLSLVVLISLLTLATLGLQIYVLHKSNKVKNTTAFYAMLFAPVIFAVFISIGAVTVAVIQLIDSSNAGGTWSNLFSTVGKSILFILVSHLKSAFGVLVAGYAIIWEAYNYFTYGKFQPLPLISSFLDWVFNFGPDWLGSAWLAFQIILSCANASTLAFLDG
jgi:hypothetical protein